MTVIIISEISFPLAKEKGVKTKKSSVDLLYQTQSFDILTA